MARFKGDLEDLSVELGFDGIITGEVLAIAKAQEWTEEDVMVTREQTAAGVAECIAREVGSYPCQELAIMAAEALPGTVALAMGGEYLVVRLAVAERLAAMQLPFAKLGRTARADGKIIVVTVPVNCN